MNIGDRVTVTVKGDRVPATIAAFGSTGSVRVVLDEAVDVGGRLFTTVYRHPDDCQPVNAHAMFAERFEAVVHLGPVIHIAGLDVRVGTLRRQRCAWCGAVLLDEDLAAIQVGLPPGKSEAQARADGDLDPPGAWPVGELVARDGAATYVVEHEDGAVLPEGCCAKLDPEVTT